MMAAMGWCAERAFHHLTVKTLAETVADDHYVETRAFYEAIGFKLKDILPNLWGLGMDCAVYGCDLKHKRR